MTKGFFDSPLHYEIAKMQVLIVDSSMLIMDRLEEMLSSIKSISAIEKAYTFSQAITMFEKNKCDVVLLDIDLPRKESFKFLKHIKHVNCLTKVMILSAQNDRFVQRQCRLMGADFYFDKYHEFQKIAEVINGIYSESV